MKQQSWTTFWFRLGQGICNSPRLQIHMFISLTWKWRNQEWKVYNESCPHPKQYHSDPTCRRGDGQNRRDSRQNWRFIQNIFKAKMFPFWEDWWFKGWLTSITENYCWSGISKERRQLQLNRFWEIFKQQPQKFQGILNFPSHSRYLLLKDCV